jgi:nucleoside-diphosphate-sugar epimerase
MLSGEKKTGHLKRLQNADENLRLFKADLLEYDAMVAAIAGCQGVFHVATPVPSEDLTDPEASYVIDSKTCTISSLTDYYTYAMRYTTLQLQMLSPAVTGTTNVLKAASAANVQRVVVVSSIAAVEINPERLASRKDQG